MRGGMFTQAYDVVSYLVKKQPWMYFSATFLIILGTLAETASLVILADLISGVMGKKNLSEINVQGFEIPFGTLGVFLSIMSLVTIGSFLSFTSTTIFFRGYMRIEGSIIEKMLPGSIWNHIELGRQRDQVISSTLNVLGQEIRLLSEANYYLRFLFEAFIYIVIFCGAIIFLFPFLGTIFVTATVFLSVLLFQIGERNNTATNSIINEKVRSRPLECASWIIQNVRFLRGIRLTDKAIENFSLIAKKTSFSIVEFYIVADLKRAVTLPFLVGLTLLVMAAISVFYGEDAPSFLVMMLLVYRVLPRFTYLGPQIKAISRANPAISQIQMIEAPAPLEWYKFNHFWKEEKTGVNTSERNLAKIGEHKIAPGHLYCLWGPSGSGKSSVLDQLIGIEGRKLNGPAIECYSSDVIYVSQDIMNTLPSTLEDLETFFNLLPKANNFRKALSALGVAEFKENTDGYSGGEKQRVATALMLSQKADLFFLDEISSGLDVQSERAVLELVLSKCRDEGVCVVWASHSERVRDAADCIIDVESLSIQWED
jgi:ABC-type Mn2+/Zn2+ transport system ATPase subunit